MSCLFEFVRQFSDELANLAERIEDNIFSEPHASLIQIRVYSEHLVKLISEEEEIESVYPLKHAERIHKLYRENAIEEDIYTKLEWIRKKGNKASHDVAEVEIADAMQAHKFLFDISVWYMQIYVTHEFTAPLYKLPVALSSHPLNIHDMDKVIKPYLDKKLDDIKADIERQIAEIRKEKESMQYSKTNTVEEEKLPAEEINKELYQIFESNDFLFKNKTKKAVEFEHKISKEIVYLLPNKRMTIVLHPDTAKQNFEIPDKRTHSTVLRRFPKEIKNGKTETNFGYPFRFQNKEELNYFLHKFSGIQIQNT